MVLEAEMLAVLNNMNAKLDCTRNHLGSINEHLKELIEIEKGKKGRYETSFAREMVINASTIYKSNGVNNPGFNRCRVEVAAVFDPAASSGLEVQMIYGNSPIGNVFDLGPVNGSAMMRSEPIDVKELGGFQFEIRNNDTAYSVTLRKAIVILYND